MTSPLRIAIFGQALFGRDVALRLAEAGHCIVYVHVPPDAPGKGRSDPLAALAQERAWPLFRHPGYRRRGQPIAERVSEYAACAADLNVLPFTTVILPPEIVDAPRLGSLCFHPSLLPAYRGGNALAWQIILGARETGVTVFRPDAGVDTGPIVVQRGGVAILPGDNTVSLYFDRLYPLGLEAMAEAVEAVAAGRASPRPQPEAGASSQGLVDDRVARIDWTRSGDELDRLIRGCDPQPGALAFAAGQPVRLYNETLVRCDHSSPAGTILPFEPAGADPEKDSPLRVAAEGGWVLAVAKLKVGENGKKGPAREAGLEPGQRLA